MIEILQAPPFLTVQDLGRHGLRSRGIPPAGAMDPDSLSLANLLLGNRPDAAGFEWALGTGTIRVRERHALAIVGASLLLNGMKVAAGSAVTADPGDEVGIGLPERRFAYLAVAGGIAVPPVLGSRSTYLVARFGGHEGRRLRNGDVLPLGPALEPTSDSMWSLPEEYRAGPGGPVRLVPGPQSDLFHQAAWDQLLGGAYAITKASDRMGYRLEGPPLRHRGTASLPSEPVIPGAIQVPDGGAPIILMPDGPTVGGYPKLAAVITADLGHFAQHAPGSRPRFVLVTFDEAVAALRDRHAWLREAAQLLTSDS